MIRRSQTPKKTVVSDGKSPRPSISRVNKTPIRLKPAWNSFMTDAEKFKLTPDQAQRRKDQIQSTHNLLLNDDVDIDVNLMSALKSPGEIQTETPRKMSIAKKRRPSTPSRPASTSTTPESLTSKRDLTPSRSEFSTPNSPHISKRFTQKSPTPVRSRSLSRTKSTSTLKINYASQCCDMLSCLLAEMSAYESLSGKCSPKLSASLISDLQTSDLDTQWPRIITSLVHINCALLTNLTEMNLAHDEEVRKRQELELRLIKLESQSLGQTSRVSVTGGGSALDWTPFTAR